MVKQSNVNQQTHRHEQIDIRLEFQQEVDIQPAVAPAHSPDHIIGAGPQIVADIAARLLFQRGEIQLHNPVFFDEAVEQIRNHRRMGKQQLVAGIMRLRELLTCFDRVAAGTIRCTGSGWFRHSSSAKKGNFSRQFAERHAIHGVAGRSVAEADPVGNVIVHLLIALDFGFQLVDEILLFAHAPAQP